MIFSIAIYGAPYSSQASLSALQYARAVIEQGHTLQRVFFYHDGIYAGNSFATPPQDEPDIVCQWSNFAAKEQVELIVCIASSLRRGLLDETEANRYEKTGSNLAPGFVISGLGQLIDAQINCDRIMTFGG